MFFIVILTVGTALAAVRYGVGRGLAPAVNKHRIKMLVEPSLPLTRKVARRRRGGRREAINIKFLLSLPQSFFRRKMTAPSSEGAYDGQPQGLPLRILSNRKFARLSLPCVKGGGLPRGNSEGLFCRTESIIIILLQTQKAYARI